MLTNRLRTTALALLAVAALWTAPDAQAHPLLPTRDRASHPAARSSGRPFVLVDASSGAVVRARPGGAILGALGGVTPLGTPTWLWALAESRDGAGRGCPAVAPNGRTAWISIAGRRTVHTRTWVQVDVSRRRVMLMQGDAVVDSYVAAVGTSTSATPSGRFSVTRPRRHGRPVRPVRLVRLRALRTPAAPARRVDGRRPARDPLDERPGVARDARLGRLSAGVGRSAPGAQATAPPGHARGDPSVIVRPSVTIVMRVEPAASGHEPSAPGRRRSPSGRPRFSSSWPTAARRARSRLRFT